MYNVPWYSHDIFPSYVYIHTWHDMTWHDQTWPDMTRHDHTYIHTYYLHTYVHTYIHIYIHTYILTTYIHTYVRTYVRAYVRTYPLYKSTLGPGPFFVPPSACLPNRLSQEDELQSLSDRSTAARSSGMQIFHGSILVIWGRELENHHKSSFSWDIIYCYVK